MAVKVFICVLANTISEILYLQIPYLKEKKCKQPTRWFQKAFKCDKFAKRCDKNDPEMIIPQCACQLVWARGTRDSNKFCQRLSEIEKDNLISLTTAAMKNKLEILPQNRKARIMMIKSLYKGQHFI